METNQTLGTANVDNLQLGGGAQFWAYIGNGVEKFLQKWSVKFEQQDGNWSGIITSDKPTQQLKTPGLSGIFKVAVTGYGAHGEQIAWEIKVKPGTNPNIGCNSNCASMVVIGVNDAGTGVEYYTTWDAICSSGK